MRVSPIAKEIFSRAEVIKQRLKVMSQPSYQPVEIPDPRFSYRDLAPCWQEPLETIEEIPALESDSTAGDSLPEINKLIQRTLVKVSPQRPATVLRPEVYLHMAAKVQMIVKDFSVKEALEIVAVLNAGTFVVDKRGVTDVCEKIKSICFDNDVLLRITGVDVDTQVFEMRVIETKLSAVPKVKTPPRQIFHCHFSEQGSIWDQLEQEQKTDSSQTPEVQMFTPVVSSHPQRPRMTTRSTRKFSVADYGSPFFGTTRERRTCYNEFIPLDRWSAAATYDFKRKFHPTGFGRSRAKLNTLSRSPDSDENPFLATTSKALQKRRLQFFGVEARVDDEGKTSFVDSTKPVSTWIDVKTASRIPRPLGGFPRSFSAPPASEGRTPAYQAERQPARQLECRGERPRQQQGEPVNSVRPTQAFQRRFLL
ncbi:uncharacterized protein LAJ45_01178 [Morchella importuna]|uniref:uncharacterized protein n=1 Tax=Morchella importuna TaxID=1174673 RepID=UPI001E8DFB8F|nr:uncharacterized protein LAJ45_01178 [Morchella importuna]KAH8154650.1 hypothetical protein LAJ45_01178 [Morchella importuna]